MLTVEACIAEMRKLVEICPAKEEPRGPSHYEAICDRCWKARELIAAWDSSQRRKALVTHRVNGVHRRPDSGVECAGCGKPLRAGFSATHFREYGYHCPRCADDRRAGRLPRAGRA